MACPSSCKARNCKLTYREHLLSINLAPSAIPTRTASRRKDKPKRDNP